MWCNRLSPSRSYWFNESCQACLWCSFCFCVSIHGTHLLQTLWYSNGVTIISSALKPIFSSVYRSLIIICWFTWISWSRLSSFCVWQLCTAVRNVACLSHHCCHCWNAPPTASLFSYPPFALLKHSSNVNECQWVPFFPHGGIQLHTFASSILPSKMSFCQTAPLLPSVTWQQNLMQY